MGFKTGNVLLIDTKIDEISTFEIRDFVRDSELASVEDVMRKLGNVTTNPEEVNLRASKSRKNTIRRA